MSLDFNDAPTQLRAVDGPTWDARVDMVREAIRGQAAEFVRELFPLARLSTTEARIGDIGGAPGESMSIALAGQSAGQWFDHATGEGGDLLDLWRHHREGNFVVAVEELEAWLGISNRPRWTTAVAKEAARRQERAKHAPKPDTTLPAPAATYHYVSADGVILGIVRRYEFHDQLDERGKPKKTFRPSNARGEPKMPDPRPLFRQPEINGASAVVLVEGEKCALALQTVGIEATTAMGGAKADPAKTDWSPLAGKTVVIWEDNDEAGQGLADRVRPYLEAIGCDVRIMPLPPGKPAKWDAADAVAEGEDIPALLQRATKPSSEAATPAAPDRTLRLLSMDDLAALKPPEWLIEGVAPAGGFVSIYGAHGSLKSFLALDWALCVAYGRPWLGAHPVKPGRVVYVAGEGQIGLAPRILGWRKAKGLLAEPAPFHVVPQAVAMSVQQQLDELIAVISTLATPPSLIVLDTLARTFGPGDENSQKDMNAYVAGVDRLRAATGATVLVIHHTGKDDSKGTRGSTALPGAVDTNIMVKRDRDTIVLKNKAPHGKQKDAEEFEDITLGFDKIAFDHQGQQATTLVLVQREAQPQDDDAEGDYRPRSGRPQGANQQAVMAALKRAKGEPLGMTRLASMLGKDNSAVTHAVGALAEKGLVRELEGEVRRWVLA